MLKELKTKSVTIRVTDNEFEAMNRKAKCKGLDRTKYLLDLVRKDAVEENDMYDECKDGIEFAQKGGMISHLEGLHYESMVYDCELYVYDFKGKTYEAIRDGSHTDVSEVSSVEKGINDMESFRKEYEVYKK